MYDVFWNDSVFGIKIKSFECIYFLPIMYNNKLTISLFSGDNNNITYIGDIKQIEKYIGLKYKDYTSLNVPYIVKKLDACFSVEDLQTFDLYNNFVFVDSYLLTKRLEHEALSAIERATKF